MEKPLPSSIVAEAFARAAHFPTPFYSNHGRSEPSTKTWTISRAFDGGKGFKVEKDPPSSFRRRCLDFEKQLFT